MEDEEQDENDPKWLFRVSNDQGLAELSAPTSVDRKEWVQKLREAVENVPNATMDIALLEMKRVVRTRATSFSQHDDRLLKDAEVLKRGYVDVFEISKGWKKYYVTLTPNAFVVWKNYTRNVIHRKISVTPDTIVKSGSVIGFEDTVRKKKDTLQKVSNFIAKNNPLNKHRKRDPKTCLEVLSKHELHDPVYISATSSREAEKWRAAVVNASNRIEQDSETYDTKKLAAELELFNDVRTLLFESTFFEMYRLRVATYRYANPTVSTYAQRCASCSKFEETLLCSRRVRRDCPHCCSIRQTFRYNMPHLMIAISISRNSYTLL